jgi:hypothetical protein
MENETGLMGYNPSVVENIKERAANSEQKWMNRAFLFIHSKNVSGIPSGLCI